MEYNVGSNHGVICECAMVSNYRYPIWYCSNWMPVIEHPRDWGPITWYKSTLSEVKNAISEIYLGKCGQDRSITITYKQEISVLYWKIVKNYVLHYIRSMNGLIPEQEWYMLNYYWHILNITSFWFLLLTILFRKKRQGECYNHW